MFKKDIREAYRLKKTGKPFAYYDILITLP